MAANNDTSIGSLVLDETQAEPRFSSTRSNSPALTPGQTSPNTQYLNVSEERLREILSEELNKTKNTNEQNIDENSQLNKEISKEVKVAYNTISDTDEEDTQLKWDFTEVYTSRDNQEVTSQIIGMVKNRMAVSNTALIRRRIKVFFDSKKRAYKEEVKGIRGEKLQKIRRLQRRSNLKDKRRRSSASMNLPENFKISEILNTTTFISSDESAEDEDGSKVLIAKILPWRTSKLTDLFTKMDAETKRKENVKGNVSYRRTVGAKVSSRPRPESIPDWAKDPSE